MGSTEAILVATAFVAAILSAVVGMAGGILLLSVMLLFQSPLVAIPLHGAIQLASNSSRAVVQRAHIRWSIVAAFAVLLIPAGFVGLELATRLPTGALKGVIGAFVLVATWIPVHRARSRAVGTRRFVALGAVAGALNTSIGATGPLIAPFFLNLGFSRHQIIGTKAACQMAGHFSKLVVFGWTGFAFRDYLPFLVAAAVAVVAGTWVGSKLLDRVAERWFVRLYKAVLSAIALRLIWQAIRS